jgi:hypothetical protein
MLEAVADLDLRERRDRGRPLYRGDYTYRSRDYRFLGGIGYWDALVLSLEAGDNDLLFAVSEDSGGWGVQARFPEPDGLSFEPATRPGSGRTPAKPS